MKYFDLHCDTLYEMYEKKEGFFENSLHTDGKRRRVFLGEKQVYAIWSSPERSDGENFKRFFDVLEYAKSFSEFPKIITGRENLDKNGAVLSVEGAGMLENDIGRAELLYKSGVRLITLAWEGVNYTCGSYDTDTGLTEFGKNVCLFCAEKGMIVDVSHLSDKGISEVLDIASVTGLSVTASHSCLRSICDERRNLSDEHAKRLAELGGCIGINLVGTHLSGSYFSSGAHLCDVMRHIEYAASLMGTKAVCIGADFDGTEKLPEEIGGLQDMEKLYNMLPSDIAEDVFYNNAYNFFKRSLK